MKVYRLVAVLVAGLGTAYCAGGGSTPTSSSGTPSVTAFTINIVGTDKGQLSFSPNPAGAGGQNVVFKNATADVHRVVLNDGSVDTGDIGAGQTSKVVVMPPAGTNYHCSIHTNMGGGVAPQAGGDPPPCTGYCY